MTMATDLANLTDTEQTKEQAASTAYLSNPGKRDLFGFLSLRAQMGKRDGNLHINVKTNPSTLKAGFATLSGELAIINSPPTPGLVTRNTIGYMYLGEPGITIAQFQAEVNAFVTDLVTNEGLTVAANIGASIADLAITW